MTEAFDHLVIGAGLTGLRHALASYREHPDDALLVVERDSRPGGEVRTQRSNGFVCELGPFAFARDEIAPLLDALERPPAIIESRCRSGFVHDGDALQPCPVDPVPISFTSGCEEVVQAARRELGRRLRLGRAATELEVTDAAFTITLAGEVPATVHARRLTLAVKLPDAARLLAASDRRLGELADEFRLEPRAFVYLGGLAAECETLAGYGIAPTPPPATAAPAATVATVEVIHCSNALPRRCLPDRFLVRCELAGPGIPDLDDDAITERATADLRRLSGHEAPFGFTKVHRFTTVARDAIWVECLTRAQAIAREIPAIVIG